MARRIDFAWELGGRSGHVTTLLPIARALKSRGHAVRFLLKEVDSGADLEGAADIPREGAPNWVGPAVYDSPRNFGEILHNFGYHDPGALKQLVDAWRERLRQSDAVIANVAPAAHLAARTLNVPSFEISQGFHNPPPTMPSPPLRDWETVPRAELEAADQRVVGAINAVLTGYGAQPLDSIGAIFAGRSMLLTYPELDIYPDRGPADYYGIPEGGEGSIVPSWPPGSGVRALAYLYRDYPLLELLAAALARGGISTLAFCRGLPAHIEAKYASSSVRFSGEPMAVSPLLPQCDVVICHGSHQMTAQALLAGKPVLLLPTQLEQFLITRRVVRQSMGLGVASDVRDADFGAALAALAGDSRYAAQAREFAKRYAGHSRAAALATMVARCEAALRP